jgi:hypothetical protein
MSDSSRTAIAVDLQKAALEFKIELAQLIRGVEQQSKQKHVFSHALGELLDELKERILQGDGERAAARPVLAKAMAIHSEGEALSRKLWDLWDLIERLSESRYVIQSLAGGENLSTLLSKGAARHDELLAKFDESLAKLETTLLGAVASEPSPIVFPRIRKNHEGTPPVAANFLLNRLLIKADRDAILGDMEEEFGTKLAKDSPTRARWWFWRETLWTIAQRNPVCRSILVTGVMRLVEWIFRPIGS